MSQKVVIDRDNNLITVEEDCIQCTVCGEWKRKEDYCKNLDGKVQNRMLRTNCFDCFNLSSEEFNQKDKEWEKLQKSDSFQRALSAAEDKLRDYRHSYSKKDLLDIINSLDGNKRYIFTYGDFNDKSYFEMTSEVNEEIVIEIDGEKITICELY